MNSENKVFSLLTISIFLMVLLPSMVQQGMFFDGVSYAAIAKNLAHGIGTYFQPHYTKTIYPEFYEHPPLAFILQSFFFRIFGDGFWTEKMYCLGSAVLIALGIIKNWSLFSQTKNLKKAYWLPILLWITIPLTIWSLNNNMLENTVMIFTTWSVYFISKSLMDKIVSLLFLASIFIIFSFLTKGFVGIFPIVTPLVFGVIYKNYKTSFLYFIYLILLIGLIAFILTIIFPDLKSNIYHYFNRQLIPALQNKREISVTSRFSILLKLIVALSFPILLVIVSYIKNRIAYKNKESIFFLFIGISGSLPLIISMKQYDFYLVPSLVFYILSISFFIYPKIDSWISNISIIYLKSINRFSAIIIIGTLFFSITHFGKFSRDKDMIEDIYKINSIVPENSIVSSTYNLCNDWTFVAYLSRMGNLSLECEGSNKFFLINRDQEKVDYEKIPIKLIKYNLLKKKSENN